MITSLNIFLLPLENSIKKYRKYIGYFILLLALCSVGYLFTDNTSKDSGEKAMLVLWIILWIPIFARVFALRVFAQILPLRKELGILMGVLALVHGFSFIIPNQEYMNSPGAVWGPSGPTFLFFGILAMWLSVPLTLTSSVWAMRKLGKHWKTLHRLVYAIVLLAVVHVALIRGWKYFDFTYITLFIAYMGFKILEWRGFSLLKRNG